MLMISILLLILRISRDYRIDNENSASNIDTMMNNVILRTWNTLVSLILMHFGVCKLIFNKSHFSCSYLFYGFWLHEW